MTALQESPTRTGFDSPKGKNNMSSIAQLRNIGISAHIEIKLTEKANVHDGGVHRPQSTHRHAIHAVNVSTVRKISGAIVSGNTSRRRI